MEEDPEPEAMEEDEDEEESITPMLPTAAEEEQLEKEGVDAPVSPEAVATITAAVGRLSSPESDPEADDPEPVGEEEDPEPVKRPREEEPEVEKEASSGSSDPSGASPSKKAKRPIIPSRKTGRKKKKKRTVVKKKKKPVSPVAVSPAVAAAPTSPIVDEDHPSVEVAMDDQDDVMSEDPEAIAQEADEIERAVAERKRKAEELRRTNSDLVTDTPATSRKSPDKKKRTEATQNGHNGMVVLLLSNIVYGVYASEEAVKAYIEEEGLNSKATVLRPLPGNWKEVGFSFCVSLSINTTDSFSGPRQMQTLGEERLHRHAVRPPEEAAVLGLRMI